jgi:hypothetical protein
MEDELDYWRYTAFKLAQAVCSMTAIHSRGTFGEEWYNEAAEVQKHYRAFGLDEHRIGRPERGVWNPEWEHGTNS